MADYVVEIGIRADGAWDGMRLEQLSSVAGRSRLSGWPASSARTLRLCFATGETIQETAIDAEVASRLTEQQALTRFMARLRSGHELDRALEDALGAEDVLRHAVEMSHVFAQNVDRALVDEVIDASSDALGIALPAAIHSRVRARLIAKCDR